MYLVVLRCDLRVLFIIRVGGPVPARKHEVDAAANY